MKASDFIQKIFMSQSGVSSKRVFGALGWFVCLFVVIYCTVLAIPAPTIAEILFYCSSALLGIDSVMSPFKNKKYETNGSGVQQNNSN